MNFDLEVIGCPIVREEDGLAKSSRNTYLSDAERKAALVLNQSLKKGQQCIESGERSAESVKQAVRSHLEAEPQAKIDYVEIVDWNTLQPVETLEKPVLLAIAVYIGKTRLIDNFVWE